MISEGLCDTEDWNNDPENLDTIWTLGQIPVIITVYKMNKQIALQLIKQRTSHNFDSFLKVH